MFKKFIVLLLVFVFILVPGKVEAVSATVEEQQQAVIETALAYLRQGSQVQYDYYRRNLYASPEDATPEHTIYTICSGYTFQVYYQALGIELPSTGLIDFARTNKDNTSNVLFYYDTTEEVFSENVMGTAEKANYSQLVKEWVELLQPGDLLAVQYKNGTKIDGHVVIIESIDTETGKIKFLESAGDNYNYASQTERYEKEGSIKELDLEARMKAYYNNYVNNVNNILTKMGVIRVITDGEQYVNINGELEDYDGITETAKARLTYPKIDIEKTFKIMDTSDKESTNTLANITNTITYEITVKNNSETDYEAFDIVENIDDYLLVTDKGDGTLNENQLKWTISTLEAGKSTKVKYTVSVPNDKSLYGKVITSEGTVAGISSGKKEILINNRFINSERDKILESFDKLKDSTKTEREFINELYLDALELDIGLAGLSNLDIMSFDASVNTSGADALAVLNTKLHETGVEKYIYHNFYGLRIARIGVKEENIVGYNNWNILPESEFNDRARTVSAGILETGDIVLVYAEGENITDNDTADEESTTISNFVDKSYIYINDTLYRKTDAETFEEIKGDKLTEFLQNIAADNYLILKPAFIYERAEGVLEEEIKEVEENSKDENDKIEEEIENPPTGEIVPYIIVGLGILAVSIFYLFNKNKMYKI